MANLSISNATYGRDRSGIAKIVSNLQGDIDRAKNYIDPDGAEVKSLFNTINQYWRGEDATKFKHELRAMLISDIQLLNRYKQSVQSLTDSDFKYFTDSQSKIANTIKRK